MVVRGEALAEGEQADADEQQRTPQAQAQAEQQIEDDRDGLDPGEHREGGARLEQDHHHQGEEWHQVDERQGAQVVAAVDHQQAVQRDEGVGQLQRGEHPVLPQDVDRREAHATEQGEPEQCLEHQAAVLVAVPMRLGHRGPSFL
ncbi:hypothetical protein D3C81_1697650 [compost metagenome]